MTEHDELMKRLKKAAEDREFIPPKTVRAWITPRDAEEAAQAIERLERERQEMIVERDDCLEELAEVRAEIERKDKALEAAEQYLAFHSGPNHEPVPLQQVRGALATPATHPFREVSPIIDKCGECGEHPDHPIHNPAPALTIAALKASQVSGEDKE